jgi:hypothetical protein
MNAMSGAWGEEHRSLWSRLRIGFRRDEALGKQQADGGFSLSSFVGAWSATCPPTSASS